MSGNFEDDANMIPPGDDAPFHATDHHEGDGGEHDHEMGDQEPYFGHGDPGEGHDPNAHQGHDGDPDPYEEVKPKRSYRNLYIGASVAAILAGGMFYLQMRHAHHEVAVVHPIPIKPSLPVVAHNSVKPEVAPDNKLSPVAPASTMSKPENNSVATQTAAKMPDASSNIAVGKPNIEASKPLSGATSMPSAAVPALNDNADISDLKKDLKKATSKIDDQTKIIKSMEAKIDQQSKLIAGLSAKFVHFSSAMKTMNNSVQTTASDLEHFTAPQSNVPSSENQVLTGYHLLGVSRTVDVVKLPDGKTVNIRMGQDISGAGRAMKTVPYMMPSANNDGSDTQSWELVTTKGRIIP